MTRTGIICLHTEGRTAAWEKDLKQAVTQLNENGYDAYISDGMLWVDFYGTSLFQNEYDGIMAQIKKSKYQKIYKKLVR